MAGEFVSIFCPFGDKIGKPSVERRIAAILIYARKLLKDYQVKDPNQVEAAEVTYIRPEKNFIYLAVLIVVFTLVITVGVC